MDIRTLCSDSMMAIHFFVNFDIFTWLYLAYFLVYYSLSRKTVNARENFWNVYCFATNQMRDETAKDNRQTAAGISHDLI